MVDGAICGTTLFIIVHFDDLFKGVTKRPSFNFLIRVLLPLNQLLMSECYLPKFDEVLERCLYLIQKQLCDSHVLLKSAEANLRADTH